MFIALGFIRNIVSPKHLQLTVCRTLPVSLRNYSYKHKKLQNILATMPKKVDVKELQGIRLARREKVRKYPPSTVYLQVLGSGAPGAPKALYVFTDHARFLFNCGEGSQRLAYEHKVKLGMMEHILVTHKTWSNVGGLLGFFLTLQDAGVPKLTLHGPSGIDIMHEDTRHFVRFRDLKINYKHYVENEGLCTDDNDPLCIQAVPLWGKEEEKSSEGKELMPDNQGEVEDLYAHEQPWLRRKNRHGKEFISPEEREKRLEERKKRLEESKKSKNLAIAYICRPPPKAGALLLERCVKAGVPPGPLLGDLKKGKDITLPNGNVVLASDVTAPDDPGPVFIVVEAPTVAYLDSLLESPSFSKYQSTATCNEDLAELVVHFTPSDVMSDPRYQEWMSRFSPSTSHLCLNDKSVCLGSEAVHRIQYKLNLLSDQLFPLLKDNSIPLREQKDLNGCENDEKGCDSLGRENGDSSLGDSVQKIADMPLTDSPCASTNSKVVVGPVHQATTLMKYHIRPKKKLDRATDLGLSPETYHKECYVMENFESSLLDARSKLCNSDETAVGASSHPNVIFLGTGSCIPNKSRNTSGILINLSTEKSLLLDCAEGTYGQLVRLLGYAGSEEALRSLAAVYVSHLHADHHIGFIRLLLARRKAFNLIGVEKVPKLPLLAPKNIIAYLSSYHYNFEPILQDFTLIENQKFLSSDFKSEEAYTNICTQLDMKDIDMTYVIHCPNSFGVSWMHKDGWKLTYSGDTMPCDDLVRIGKNCDLLIHEATMEDELEEDARIKTHSTTSQAIQVGREMNAKHTILTHFSQRYAKVPLLQADVPENVGIAFDNMKVCLHNLPKLHHMYSALVAMFAEDYDVMVERSAKKRANREHMKVLLEEQMTKNSDLENSSKKQKVNVP